MALNTVTTGNTVLASDVNQLVNVLQRAASQTESGAYALNLWGSANGDSMGYGVSTLSRVSTPVSVSVDTSLQSPASCNTPSTSLLTASGFQVRTTTTGASTNASVAGLYTVQY